MLDIDNLEQYNKNTKIEVKEVKEGIGFIANQNESILFKDDNWIPDTYSSSTSNPIKIPEQQKPLKNYNLIDEINEKFTKLSYSLYDLTYNCKYFIKYKEEFILNRFNDKFANEYDINYYKFNTFNIYNHTSILKNIYTNLETFYIDEKLKDYSYNLVDEILVDYKNFIFYIHSEQIYFIQYINDKNTTDYKDYKFFIYDKYQFLDKGLIQFNPLKNINNKNCTKCPFKAICSICTN